jgi:hypothetical protein
LIVDKTELLLETDGYGHGNWQFGNLLKSFQKQTKTADEFQESRPGKDSRYKLPFRPWIRKMHLNETHITFIDAKTNNRINIDNEKLHLESTGNDLVIGLKGALNDVPFFLSGTFDNSDFLSVDQPTPVRFDGHLGDIQLFVRGTAGPLTLIERKLSS